MYSTLQSVFVDVWRCRRVRCAHLVLLNHSSAILLHFSFWHTMYSGYNCPVYSSPDLILLSNVCALVVMEAAALRAFKAGVTDPGKNLESWTGDDPCSSWSGITCEYISGGNHVTQITLPHFELGGKLAPEIGNLTQLQVLNLKFNSIEGNIPTAFSKLTNLFRL